MKFFIWRNAKVLTKRCHFPCSILNLPIPSADSITAYQLLYVKSYVLIMAQAAILDLRLQKKMPGFLRGTLGLNIFLKGSRKSNQSSKHLSQKKVMKVRFFTLLIIM